VTRLVHNVDLPIWDATTMG